MILKLGGILRRRGPERGALSIGYVPTLDASTLLIAQAKGFFSNEGLDVNLIRQPSWQKATERMTSGDLDAAHLSATVPLAAHLGMQGDALPLRTAFVLALGGSSFAVRPELATELQKRIPVGEELNPLRLMKAMKGLVAQRAADGDKPLRFAVTDCFGVGCYDLKYCLAAAGIDPACDVEISAVAPGRMLATLRNGHYDGAWLDEPIGSLAQSEGMFTLLFSKHAFWNNSLGKVLAVRESLVRRYPRTHMALLRALLSAAEWIEAYREDAIDLLSSRHGLDLDADTLRPLIQGIPTLCGGGVEDIAFASGAATFPWYSQAVWYLGQMIRWGDYADVLDFKKTAQAVFLPKCYRDAARELSLPHPSIGYKNEGEHAAQWELEEASQPLIMGPDRFFDGRLYKPRQTMKYLNGLDISHIAAPLDAMWAIR